MKNLSVSKRNSGAASVATKAFAWMLSIMLVVTGISPSFAANKKAAGKGVTNTVTKSEAQKGASNKAYKDSKKAGDKEKATLPEENKKKENNKASKADKNLQILTKRMQVLKENLQKITIRCKKLRQRGAAKAQALRAFLKRRLQLLKKKQQTKPTPPYGEASELTMQTLRLITKNPKI